MENKLLGIFCDGGARGNPGPAASAFVVVEKRKVIFEGSKYLGIATNNVAEYNAVILGLSWLIKNNKKENVQFVLDSELVVKQMSGFYKIKSENLRNLYQTAKSLEKKFGFKIFYVRVPRIKNKKADLLVNKTLDEN